MLFNYQLPMGQEPEGEQFNPLPTLNNNASVDSGMSLYPSAQSYDSPSNFIGQGPVQLGAAQRQRLNRQYDGLMSQVGQQAVSSGLYNTTVPITQEQAVERARGQALTGFEGQLMDEEMGAYTGMTGDALLSELQSRLSQTSEIDAATSQGIVDNISNVLDQIAFLEAKNEKGPNLDKLREIVSLLGQSMAETNGVPSVVFPNLGGGDDDEESSPKFRDSPGIGENPFQPDYETIAGVMDSVAASNANVREGDIKGDLGLRSNKSAGTGSGGGSNAGGGIGSGGAGSVGSVGSSPSGSSSSPTTSVGPSYPSAAAGTLSNPAAQEEAANAGLKLGVGDSGLPAVVPPNPADFDSGDSYAAALKSYQQFSEKYPEFAQGAFQFDDYYDDSNLDADANPISTPDREIRSDLPLAPGEISKKLPDSDYWDRTDDDMEERKKKIKQWKKQYPGTPYGYDPEEWRRIMADDYDTD